MDLTDKFASVFFKSKVFYPFLLVVFIVAGLYTVGSIQDIMADPPSKERTIPQAMSTVWHIYTGGFQASVVAFESRKVDGKFVTFWLTAKHVCDDKDPFGMAYPWNATSETMSDLGVILNIVAKHPEGDIAIFKSVTDYKIDTIDVSMECPEIGDMVYLAGWSEGMGLFLRAGYQSSILGSASYECSRGDSGGAVFTANGKLIGINRSVWITKEPFKHIVDSMSFYTPILDHYVWIVKTIGAKAK